MNVDQLESPGIVFRLFRLADDERRRAALGDGNGARPSPRPAALRATRRGVRPAEAGRFGCIRPSPRHHKGGEGGVRPRHEKGGVPRGELFHSSPG